MLSQQKIRQMVQNEVYLKTQFKDDKFVAKYFKSDYVGLQRIKALIVFFILFVCYILFDVFRRFYVESEDMLNFDYQGYVIKAVVALVLIGAGIAVLATFIASIRYEEASQRVYDHEDAIKEIAEE